jgi:hypothetical protein
MKKNYRKALGKMNQARNLRTEWLRLKKLYNVRRKKISDLRHAGKTSQAFKDRAKARAVIKVLRKRQHLYKQMMENIRRKQLRLSRLSRKYATRGKPYRRHILRHRRAARRFGDVKKFNRRVAIHKHHAFLNKVKALSIRRARATVRRKLQAMRLRLTRTRNATSRMNLIRDINKQKHKLKHFRKHWIQTRFRQLQEREQFRKNHIREHYAHLLRKDGKNGGKRQAQIKQQEKNALRMLNWKIEQKNKFSGKIKSKNAKRMRGLKSDAWQRATRDKLRPRPVEDLPTYRGPKNSFNYKVLKLRALKAKRWEEAKKKHCANKDRKKYVDTVVNKYLDDRAKERYNYRREHTDHVHKGHGYESDVDQKRTPRTIKRIIEKENLVPPDPNKCVGNKATRL